MKKVVAVRIRDDGDGRLVTAYVGREKNRRVAWAFRADSKDPVVIRAMADQAEENRVRPKGVPSAVENLKGDSDDDFSG